MPIVLCGLNLETNLLYLNVCIQFYTLTCDLYTHTTAIFMRNLIVYCTVLQWTSMMAPITFHIEFPVLILNKMTPTFLKSLKPCPHSSFTSPTPKTSPHRSLRASVVFTTWLPRVLGCSTVNFNSVLGPGDHSAVGYSAAAGQAGHLARRKDPVPKSHLGQLSNQGLG